MNWSQAWGLAGAGVALVAGHWFVIGYVLVALLVVAGLVYLVRLLRAAGGRAGRPAGSGQRTDNVLTLLAAGVAEAVTATGMWHVFSDVLRLPLGPRIALFTFLDLAILTSALRARRNLRRPPHRAGIDGAAVWVLAGLSALLSALDAGSVPEAAVRLAAPLVAAWLWERGLAGRREAAGAETRVHWRLSPERVLAWLRLADPTGRTAGEVEVTRRLLALARARYRLHVLRTANAAGWRQQHAARTLMRRTWAAVHHTGLATDPAVRGQLDRYLTTLYRIDADTSISALIGTRGNSTDRNETPEKPNREPRHRARPNRPARSAGIDVSDLIGPGSRVLRELTAAGTPLTKRNLIDGLRSGGHTVGADRALELLRLLKNTNTETTDNTATTEKVA